MKTRAALRTRLTLAAAVPACLLVVCFFAGLWTGAVGVGPMEALGQVASHLTGRAGPETSIIWDLRLPRILLAAVVGAVLAAGGAAMQGLLGNPLAEPYTAGVSSGCVLGASLAVILGLDSVAGGWPVPAAAFLTGLAAVLLVLALARRSGKLDVNTFLLAGIIVGAFFWAVTTFVLSLAREDIARIFMWLAGSFAAPYPWDYLKMASVIGLLCLAGLFWNARDLNAFALGEDQARSLGVEPERLKAMVILLTTLGTAACVSAAGVIGFAGLIVPHGMRRVFGPDHRPLLVSSALCGACLLVLADALARSLAPPREVPVGVITSIVGAPVFLWILSRGRA
ncbi:MAG: heme ABC transporter permease [Armatimonadota bacterium]|nr:MAG: heme ABC transporter permease [Armatimonadota bacterium]